MIDPADHTTDSERAFLGNDTEYGELGKFEVKLRLRDLADCIVRGIAEAAAFNMEEGEPQTVLQNRIDDGTLLYSDLLDLSGIDSLFSMKCALFQTLKVMKAQEAMERLTRVAK